MFENITTCASSTVEQLANTDPLTPQFNIFKLLPLLAGNLLLFGQYQYLYRKLTIFVNRHSNIIKLAGLTVSCVINELIGKQCARTEKI